MKAVSWKWRLITKFCFIPPGSQQAGFLNALKDSPARYPFQAVVFHHVNVLSIGLAFSSVTSSWALAFLVINHIPLLLWSIQRAPWYSPAWVTAFELLKTRSDSYSLVETEVLFCWKTKCEFLPTSRNPHWFALSLIGLRRSQAEFQLTSIWSAGGPYKIFMGAPVWDPSCCGHMRILWPSV